MPPPTVMITGVTKGIGRALASGYAEKGATIIGIARDGAAAGELLAGIEKRHGVRCLALEADLADSPSVERAIQSASLSVEGIDILVNNAGVGSFDEFSRLTDTAWRAMIDVNLGGAVHCTRLVLPFMSGRRSGAIVNVASICGLEGYALCTAYCATKFALVGFSEALAKEAARFNIFVYAVCPDIVDTGFAGNRNAQLTQPRKMLTPGEVASAIIDLTSRRPRSQICTIRFHAFARKLFRLGVVWRLIRVKRIRWI